MKLVWILFLMIFAGCASSPYGGSADKVNIQEFIYNEFVFGLDKLTGSKQIYLKEGALEVASFNGANNSLLFKPYHKLLQFCRSRGGELVLLQKAGVEFIKSINTSKKSPLQAMMEAKSYALSKHATEQVARAAAIEAYYRQLKENNTGYKDSAIFAAGVKDALKKGALGYYSCNKNGLVLWRASIDVEAYKIGNTASNMLDMPTAYLRIRGY